MSIRAALNRATGWALFASLVFGLAALLCPAGYTQQGPIRPALGDAAAARVRAQRFLAGRSVAPPATTQVPLALAQAVIAAKARRTASLNTRGPHPELAIANLTAAWQPLGPMTVTSLAYGALSGRITSIALDPNDVTGNTVWLGTTGGGVWKSTNAAGPLASVSFAPLTDTLSVFSANEGATTVPSLSIGTVAVQPATTGIVLAGTGDPNDATDSYYGEGLLRSPDGGQTWTLITGSRDGLHGNHSFAGLATAGLAWSTTTPTLAVAAMTTSLEGEVVGAVHLDAAPGLYYSADAGLTWHMAVVYDGTQIVQTPVGNGSVQTGNNATSVVWDAQRGLFLAALGAHGYYSSPDGVTWQRLVHQPGAGLTTVNCPVGPNGIGSTACPLARGVLTVQPATGDIYALSVDANGTDGGLWQDLCHANASGACANVAPVFANRIDNGALEVGQGAPGTVQVIAQGTYNLTLAAVPDIADGTLLFAGTIDLYRCDLSAGATVCTFRNTTNAGNGCNATARVAPAQHVLAVSMQGSGPALVFLGNDGGLWRSTDGVAETGPACSPSDVTHFDNLNGAIGQGGSLAEIVGFAEDSSGADTVLAGLGANGSAATTAASTLEGWPQLSAGEGGFPQIDPSAAANWYVAIGAGVNLSLCDLGAACSPSDFLGGATVGEPQVSNDAALLDAPTLLDPQSPGNLITATCRVWRGPARSGAGWGAANALSPAMDGSATPCTLSSALVRSLGAGGPVATAGNAPHLGSEVIYAGMAGVFSGGGSLGGHVFVITAANTAGGSTPWTDAANGPVTNSSSLFNAYGFDISAVVPDTHDPTGGTVYATVMGFGQVAAIPHIYRSIDFGGHWTDVSANLPNAPANSLVVDPNDANTLYVAMDTGVYVTRNIASCATANCWSPLGSGLPNAPVTQLEAGAGLSTGDGRLGMLRAATYGRGLWQTPLLSAITALQPGLVANPTALSFAAQPAATESAAQTVTLTSNGNAPVTISAIAITGDFVENDTCSGQTIPVGSTCTVFVQFAPTATGARAGLLTIYANIAGGQVTAALAGTATASAAIVLTPLSLTFPSTVVNGTAASQIVTVSNTGASPAALQGTTISGDFALKQSTCGASLSAQTGCSLVITFMPTASGSRSGQLTVTDSAGTQTAQLSGAGEAPATDTLAPGSLSFPQQQVGTLSAPQAITLTNAGDVALTLISAVVTTGDFTATNGCGSSLAPHSTCAVSVTFVPTAVGTRTGSLTVTDGIRFQIVTLNGTGVAPPGVSLSPRSLDFGAFGVGLNAPPQTLTLTNNGGLPLAISSTAIGGDFAIASSTCGATLDPGSACAMAVFFAPAAAGPRMGSLVLTDNAPLGKQTVNLSGTGVDFSLIPNGATTVTVASGGSATFPLALSSLSGLGGNVAFTCTGAPAYSTCTVSPNAAALGGDVMVSVVVQTGLASAEGRPGKLWPQRGREELLLAAMPLGWFGARRRRWFSAWARRSAAFPLVVAAIALAAMAGVAGCGTAREIPLAGGSGGGAGVLTPTPAGTYNILVSGATAGITHAVNLILVIQ